LHRFPSQRHGRKNPGLKSRYGGRAFPLAEYHYGRIPLSPARAAFASARKRTEEFVVARTSRR